MSNSYDKSNYTCVRYTNAAKVKNAELDAICNQIAEYQSQIKTIFDLVSNNFPNDKSFYFGVSTVVNQINKEISSFNSSISNMKASSLKQARIKDNHETMRVRNAVIEERIME